MSDGRVVECGVWKGGMIAGIAQLFDGLLVAGVGLHRARHYHLFDSCSIEDCKRLELFTYNEADR